MIQVRKLVLYLPDPRAILPLDGFHVSRSLAKRARRVTAAQYSHNHAFEAVIRACAARKETWLDERLISAFVKLHHLGFAHSIEVWTGPEKESLWGGVYGLALGSAFFAESMFSAQRDGSKLALLNLVSRLRSNGFTLLETQFLTPHLASLGGIEISGEQYSLELSKAMESIAVKRSLDF